MAMAVLERRATALMSALGWSPREVSGIVLLEGIVVSVIGAGVGLLALRAGRRRCSATRSTSRSVVKPSGDRRGASGAG